MREPVITRPSRRRHPIRRRSTALAAVLGVTAALSIVALSNPAAASAPDRTRVIVIPSDDTYASEQQPDSTNNTDRLTAGSAPGALRLIFLRFVVPQLPAGAEDVVARVVLNRDLHHLPPSVELSSVANTTWSESTLTMTNAPPVGATLDVVYPTSATQQIAFRVSDLQAGPRAFAVTSAATDDVARFRSSEYGTLGPRLALSYRLPTATTAMWIGAAASRPLSGGGIDYSVGVFNDANAAVGPLQYRRSFDSSLPTSFQTSAARDDAANGYRSFVSWKPPNGDYVGAAQGRYDAQVTAWARSVPNTGVYATAFHEPENDMTGPQFVDMQRHLYTVVKAANPTIQWGPVYMAYWWDDGTSHYIGNKDAWWPGAAYADFTAVDVYSNDPRPLETHPEFRGWYDYMLGVGVPMLIAEYGQYVVKPGYAPDPAEQRQRADIIAQDAAWLASQNTISMWLYWDAMGSKGDWQLSDPVSQQAWRDVASTGRTG